MSSSAKRQRRSNNAHHLRDYVEERENDENDENDDDDDFVAGNIVEVELHNFMTYDYIRFHPSPRLNLLIGPNGSGKSSLVCALGLALGADPNVLGRASSVGAFVKRGQDTATVKVILRGHSAAHRIHITRKIDTANNSSWILNGSTVPKRDILEVIHNFNIQVNNLTQFLPQDRVCEFAKLTPIQLLEETEKAVGDAELPVLHSHLIDKSRQLKRLEISVEQIGDSLTQLEELNAEQEKDVGRVRKRKKLLEKVELMKKKLPWLIYDMKKMKFLEVQNLEKEAKRKLDEAAKLLNELSKPIEELKQAKSSEESSCKKINNQTSRNAGKRMELLDSEGHLSVQVRAKYTEIEEMKKQEASWQQQMTKATEDLTAAETELANIPFYEPPKDEIDKLNIQISELQLLVNQKALQKRDLEDVRNQRRNSLRKCTDRLKELDNKNMKLLQALRTSGVDKIFEAYEWLHVHRNEFKKEVFGPVLLEVNVKEQRHTAFLENAVPFYIWKSVVTQDPADRDLIVKNLRSFDIPVLNFVSNGAPERAPYEVPSELHELGIYKRLDQTFDAPSAVREILTSQSAIADSYVGTQETDRRADELSKLGIMDFWTPESHYRWSTSRYSGNISASVDPVYPSRLFTYSSDIGDVEIMKAQKMELEDAIAEADKHLKKLQFEQRQLEDNLSVLRKEQDEIVNTVRLEKKKRREMENRIDQRRRKLESMKKEEDLDTNIKMLLNQVSQLNARRFQIAIQIKDLLVEAVAYKWSFAAKHMKSLEIELQVAELEANLKQHQKIAIQASTHLEQCKIETENHRQHLASAKRQAESIAIITEDLAEEFRKMPTTVEELEAAIQDNTSQANSILFVNQNILEEYEGRQKKIEEMKGRMETDRMELKRCLSDIEATKDKWLPKLRELVAKINETFSNNFREMAVAGEVSLDEHGMDFDKYGILIKVKFRQSGQLQVLSAHHQSGGERSVSTILYLVSLQDLTNCPFRVVDEINQGMDLVNERKMFQQLVRAASQLTTPQCFLLTPKLLDNLEYGEACTVLNIMNGPWIKPASEAWKDQRCFRKITGMKRQIQT